jgi:hypothetical protein
MRKVAVLAVMVGLAMMLAGTVAHAQAVASFSLKPNPAELNCLRSTPSTVPSAFVVVRQGDINDDLTITAGGIKPGLGFDMFTVQNSNLLSTGLVNPAFKNFGLAWYQSDLEANSSGILSATIRSIFVNEIFGFDAGASPPLPPTNTYHVGFWFDSPAEAAACGFTGSTPFNGEHNAGPLAMISVPNAVTNLGPLCLSPNTSTHPATCNL